MIYNIGFGLPDFLGIDEEVLLGNDWLLLLFWFVFDSCRTGWPETSPG